MHKKNIIAFILSFLILTACENEKGEPSEENFSEFSFSKEISIEESKESVMPTDKNMTASAPVLKGKIEENVEISETESDEIDEKKKKVITSPLEVKGKKPIESDYRLVQIVQNEEEMALPEYESKTTVSSILNSIESTIYGDFDMWDENIFSDLDHLTKRNILYNQKQLPEITKFIVKISAPSPFTAMGDTLLSKTYTLKDGIFHLDMDTPSHYPAYGNLRDIETSFSSEEEISISTTTIEEKQKYEAKTYKVGENIPAGEYKVISTKGEPFYIEVATKPGGKIENIIMNDNIKGFTFVTVDEGNYFRIEDSYAISSEDAQPYQIKDFGYGSGMFRVGIDIPAGEYEVIKNNEESHAYVAILSGTRGTIDEIVWNQIVETNIWLSVYEGQYLEVRNGYIPFQ